MAPKRKHKEEEGEEHSNEENFEEDDYEEATKPKKVSKPRAKKEKKPLLQEPFTDEQGWHTEPPSLIWKDFGAEASAKVAAFDLDGTIVHTKSGADFARDASDWKWWNKDTAAKLAEFAEDGYKVVIFTNQGGIKTALDGKMALKVKQRITQVVSELKEKHGIKVQVFAAPSILDTDPCRKPNTGMWEYFATNCNSGIKPDLKQSFFCGDADGSSGAFADSDKVFAARVGLAFKTPVQVFGEMAGKAAMSREAVKAGQVAVDDGSHPNAELIRQFRQLADDIKAQVDAGEGGENAGFKIRAFRNVADALQGFNEKITDNNLKAVGKLKGIGKASLDKIKLFLKTGHIVADTGGSGDQGKAAAVATNSTMAAAKASKTTEAALKFM